MIIAASALNFQSQQATLPVKSFLQRLLNILETYRRIIDCGIKPVGNLAEYFALEPETMMIYRTYIVLINSLPTIQITKQFPTSHFLN